MADPAAGNPVARPRAGMEAHWRHRDWLEAMQGASFATPAAILLVVLILMPIAGVFVLAFSSWQLGDADLSFVGLRNFVELFRDPVFWRSLTNTLLYVAITVPTTFALALLCALAISSVGRSAGLYRTALFLPVTASVVAMATVWEFLLHPTLGPANLALARLGLDGANWLMDEDMVLPVLCLIGVWLKLGYFLVLFLAGLSTIPRDLYEAAAVDGMDSAWETFRRLTWPMLGPTSLFAAVVGTVHAFETFELVAVLTQGGPGHASEVLLHTLYVEGFGHFRTGYAAGITIVFLALILAVTFFKMRVIEPRVHYS